MKTVFYILLLLIPFQHLRAQTDSVYLWPGVVPNETKPKSPPVSTTLDDGTIRIVEVTDPFVAVFAPQSSVKNGKGILVCPGGGYVRLAIHKEGYAVAEWLTKLGYTVFVLHYRVPNKRDGALQDFQRSLKLIRQNSKVYGIDPANLSAMGFSAGAHLVARAGMTPAVQHYPAHDISDKQPGIPDRMILIYPAFLSSGAHNSLTPELQASDKTVDTFIFQTMDDSYVSSAFALATALQTAKANVTLHMLPKGGHGYGLYPGNAAAEAWPKLLAAWLGE